MIDKNRLEQKCSTWNIALTGTQLDQLDAFAALSYNIPQSYPIFQVVIEKLLILFCKYLYFSGCCSSLLWGKREPEILLAPVARGMFFFRSNGFALRAGQRQGWFFL